jgi:hypothetical protein
MRHVTIGGGALAALLLASPARASELDPATGSARTDGAAIAFGFEDASPSARAATITAGSPATIAASMPADWLVEGGIEGRRAARVPAGRALILGDGATLAPVHDARVELRFWARADGARPSGRLVYAGQSVEVQDLWFPNASIDAIETGRATSDGWVEYSTGPVDGAVGDRTKLAGIVFEAEASPTKASGFWVDAVEIVRLEPRATRAATCTLATEDAACGASGACVEGACFDGALVWGALPTAEARRDIVERQAHYFTRVSGDRYGAARAATMFTPRATAAALSARTSRAFWQPFQRAAALSRGAHTRAVGPVHYHRLSWHSVAYTRSQGNELLACFGLTLRDISGGGRGYGVFAAAPASPLRVGDVVESIDGEAPRDWLARAVPFAGLSSDPDVDDALQAATLQTLVTPLAQTLDVRRCASAATCDDASSTRVTIDLAKLRREAATLPWATQPACSLRFKLGVDVPAGADIHAYESAFESVDDEGFAHVLTNGEPPGPDLAAVVNRAFDRAPSRMIVDKRRGDGGGGDSLEVWGKRVRADATFRLLFAGRWAHESIDPPASVFASMAACDSAQSASGVCWATSASWMGIQPGAPARPEKIAWLNIVDGSASDLATTYAKGAPGVRIFAPARTMGLFGGLHHVPRFASGLSDGYLQRGDTRVGRTWEEITAAPWRSGRGVEPDESVLQTQSDLLLDKDTMLERARAWLREP